MKGATHKMNGNGSMTEADENQVDADGAVFNGFDYSLQVWVVGGVVQMCGHPDAAARGCCNASKYAG